MCVKVTSFPFASATLLNSRWKSDVLVYTCSQEMGGKTRDKASSLILSFLFVYFSFLRKSLAIWSGLASIPYPSVTLLDAGI